MRAITTIDVTRRSASTIVIAAAAGLVSVGAAHAQSDPDDAAGAAEDGIPRTESGECFTTSDLVDMTVLDERSVYVRTRTRHFLLGSGRQCENLRRAYNRNAVGFVPLGRRICPNDGSHFRYETGGRARTCLIAVITEVESLAQAQELAASQAGFGDDDLVTTRDLDPSDQEQ